MAAAPKSEGDATLGGGEGVGREGGGGYEAIDPGSLLPKVHHFFRYEGSLTTPPCSEVVEWNVFSVPVTVAQSDIDRFKELFTMNARPCSRSADESC